jgi:hypothetical protein
VAGWLVDALSLLSMEKEVTAGLALRRKPVLGSPLIHDWVAAVTSMVM